MSADAKLECDLIHDLPRDWRAERLAAVADIRFSNVNKLSESGETAVRLCNYIDVYNNDYVTSDMDYMHATATQVEIERFGLQAGDVIITKDSETPNDIGVPAVVDSAAPDLICGYHLALIRPKNGALDPTFLAKQLRHHRLARYFGQQANGSTRYGLSIAAISNAVLQLPSLAGQNQISEVLRLLDTAIAKTEALIAKLKQVRAGLLRDLLTSGLDEHGHVRDPLNQAGLNPVPVAVPPGKEQEEVVRRILLHAGSASATENELGKLRSLKSGLMSDLLTGRVRVPSNILDEKL